MQGEAGGRPGSWPNQVPPFDCRSFNATTQTSVQRHPYGKEKYTNVLEATRQKHDKAMELLRKELASRPELCKARPHLLACWELLFCHRMPNQCDKEEKHITSISDMDHRRLAALGSEHVCVCLRVSSRRSILISKVQHARFQSQKRIDKWVQLRSDRRIRCVLHMARHCLGLVITFRVEVGNCIGTSHVQELSMACVPGSAYRIEACLRGPACPMTTDLCSITDSIRQKPVVQSCESKWYHHLLCEGS